VIVVGVIHGGTTRAGMARPPSPGERERCAAPIGRLVPDSTPTVVGGKQGHNADPSSTETKLPFRMADDGRTGASSTTVLTHCQKPESAIAPFSLILRLRRGSRYGFTNRSRRFDEVRGVRLDRRRFARIVKLPLKSLTRLSRQRYRMAEPPPTATTELCGTGAGRPRRASEWHERTNDPQGSRRMRNSNEG